MSRAIKYQPAPLGRLECQIHKPNRSCNFTSAGSARRSSFTESPNLFLETKMNLPNLDLLLIDSCKRAHNHLSPKNVDVTLEICQLNLGNILP